MTERTATTPADQDSTLGFDDLHPGGNPGCSGFEASHLTKRYPNADRPVLDDVSFTVPHGQVLVVLGPSGSGKSTLLRAIAGLEPIQGGRIAIGGQVVDEGRPGSERAGR